MNRAVHKISLDIHRQGTQVNLEVKKGDTARRLVVGLVEDGAPYVVDEGCYGVFMAKKPDGNTLFNACTIENGQIVYNFTEQTVSAAGRMLCEVQLYGSDDLLITSPRIAMIVSGSLLDEGVVSESESTVLGEILEELESIRDEMDELGELEVTVSGNAADGFVSDLEFDEIRQAHDAGQACVCLWGSWRLPLVSIADEVARFAAVVDGICYQAEVSQDGVTAGDAVLDNRTRIVTMQGSEEKGYTTDFTLSAILAAHNQGPVVCLCDGIYLPLVALDGSRAVFSGHDYGTGKYTMVNFHSAGFQVTHGNIGSTGDSGDVSEGVFYINFYCTEGEYGLDSSRAEIVAAYEAGKELRCLVPVGTGVADIPLVHKTVDENGVELRFGGSSAYLKESEGGRTVSAFIGIRDGGVEWGALLHPVVRDGKYIVNITSDGRGGYKADKSYNGVLAVHNAKVLPIECRITVGDISYALPLCGLFDGRLIYGGSAGGLSLAVFHESNESIAVMADTLVTNMALEERLEPINTALETYIQDVDALIGGDG